VNKAAIAVKVLKSKTGRKIIAKAVKNEKVRKMVTKQITRRLIGR
jgi:hypothetical protein